MSLGTVVLLGYLTGGCGGQPEPLPPTAATAEVPEQQTAVPGQKDSGVDGRAVQEDVRTLTNALDQGNVDTLIRYTHPKIITMMGGEAQARAVLSQAMSKFAALGMKRESLTFPAEPTILRGGTHEFAIVPTMTVLAAAGQRVESLNFQLGVREIGAGNWTYVEGSRVNKGNVRSLFPDFPSDYEFPPTYQKKL
jgi:hypothetical protein